MRQTIMALVILFATCTFAGDDKAPLPDKITHAKTVFLVNDTGISKFGDAFYSQLKKWERWEVATDKSKADLILVLSQRDTVDGAVAIGTATAYGQAVSGSAINAPIKSSSWYLHVIDTATGQNLWTTKAGMQGKLWRMWGNIAKDLLADIQKRMK